MSQPLHRKIVAPERLVGLVAEVRRRGGTIVHCHGCFDIVHPGHIRYLQFARQLGDVLLVSLTGDPDVNKGLDRPYIPQELRAENLAALEFVDWVVIDPRPTACALLAAVRPDVYLKGREYATAADPRFTKEREVVESYGGRVVFHSGDVVFSSTHLMESIGRDRHLEEHRLRVFFRRSGIDTESVAATQEAFSGTSVIVVGDVVRERYVYCDAGETAGDAPVLSLQRLGQREYWGAAAAAALQLRALGAQPFLLTAVGGDKDSQAAIEQLGARGVEVHALNVRPALVVRQTVVADETKLFKIKDGSACPLDSAAEREAVQILSARIPAAKLLVWCDHGYGMITPGLVRGVIEPVAQSAVRVAVHAPGSRADLSAFRSADLLTATERQLRAAMHDMTSGLPAVAWNLLEKTGSRALLTALRRRGLIAFERRAQCAVTGEEPQRLKSEFVPSFATHHADLLGAEEAVLAAAGLALAVGENLATAAYFASVAETLAVSRSGGEPVMLDELRAWFATRPELRPESSFFPDAVTVADIAGLAPPLVSAPVPSVPGKQVGGSRS